MYRLKILVAGLALASSITGFDRPAYAFDLFGSHPTAVESQLIEMIRQKHATINELRASLGERAETPPVIHAKKASEEELLRILKRQDIRIAQLGAKFRVLGASKQIQLIEQQRVQIARLRSTLNMERIAFAPISPGQMGEVALQGVLQDQSEVLATLQAELKLRNENLQGLVEKNNSISARAIEEAKRLMSSGEISANPTDWVEARCTGLFDSMSSDSKLAQGRSKWGMRCMKRRLERLYDKKKSSLGDMGPADPALELSIAVSQASYTKLSFGGTPFDHNPASRWFYPTFGVIQDGKPSNPDLLIAPTSNEDDCDTAYGVDSSSQRTGKMKLDLLERYQLVAMCVTGCYTPDQLLRFGENGTWQAIGEAFEARSPKVYTLAEHATLEKPEFVPTEIAAYTVDVREALQEVLDIRTLSGKALTVTKNHAVLDQYGKMRPAESFVVGQAVVTENGGLDPIVRISGRS